MKYTEESMETRAAFKMGDLVMGTILGICGLLGVFHYEFLFAGGLIVGAYLTLSAVLGECPVGSFICKYLGARAPILASVPLEGVDSESVE